MVGKVLELKGRVYERLTVIKFLGVTKRRAIWLCQCSCGNKTKVCTSYLQSGKTRSCGCLKRELTLARTRTHGKTKTAEYGIWAGMMARCFNPNNDHYNSYGARGIKVCDKWKEFINFFNDMGLRPSDAYSIDRINVNGNYELSNCRWILKVEQQRNTQKSIHITWQGTTMCLREWAAKLGIEYKMLWARLKNGWSVAQAFTASTRERGVPIAYDGQSHTITKWAKLKGMSFSTLDNRLWRGWSVEKALTTPVKPKLITYDGESLTINEWSKIKGIIAGTISYRLVSGWSVERALTTPGRK